MMSLSDMSLFISHPQTKYIMTNQFIQIFTFGNLLFI